MYLVTTNPIVSMRSKVILDMRTNAISWNPMEAFVFLAANEDYNVYSFDVRLVFQVADDLKYCDRCSKKLFNTFYFL